MTTPPNQTNEENDKYDFICHKLKEDCDIHCQLREELEIELEKIEDSMIEYGMSLEEVGASTILFSFIKKALKDALASQEERHREIVICAAVIEEDGTIIRGHRHSDCFATIYDRGKKAIKLEDGLTQQGFVTSKNRFVDRKEAMKIQKNAGIPSADPSGDYTGNELYSEDLY